MIISIRFSFFNIKPFVVPFVNVLVKLIRTPKLEFKIQIKKVTFLTLAVGLNLLPAVSFASEPDSLKHLGEVVVTGTRTQTDSRHLPQTVTVVEPYHAMPALYAYSRQNILPTLTEQVPGLMVTSRGMMGYGVSGGAAGGMMLRGISSGAGQIMVLIDGHP